MTKLKVRYVKASDFSDIDEDALIREALINKNFEANLKKFNIPEEFKQYEKYFSKGIIVDVNMGRFFAVDVESLGVELETMEEALEFFHELQEAVETVFSDLSNELVCELMVFCSNFQIHLTDFVVDSDEPGCTACMYSGDTPIDYAYVVCYKGKTKIVDSGCETMSAENRFEDVIKLLKIHNKQIEGGKNG